MKSVFAVIALVLFAAPLRAEEFRYAPWISRPVLKIFQKPDACMEVGNFLKSLEGCSATSRSSCMELSVVLESDRTGQCIIKSVDENKNVPISIPVTIGSLSGFNHDRTFLKEFNLSIGNSIPSLWYRVDNLEHFKSFSSFNFGSTVNSDDNRKIIFRVLE